MALDDQVPKISPAALKVLTQDVAFLGNFVDSLNDPILRENLDGLFQTVALMQSENPEEFYDTGIANRKYGRVDRIQGITLLEK